MYQAKICAIGPKTKEALEMRGLQVYYVPSEYKAEQIIAGLKDKVKAGEKVLLPRADIARKILPKALVEMGAQVDDVTTYRTTLGATNASLLREMLEQKQLHILTFTSSSTVRNFVKLIGTENLPALLEGVIVASIGPITSATARELGVEVTVEAKEYTIAGLVQAILEKVKL